MWIYYNPNPAGRNVGDCSVRAISAALDVDWETAYYLVCSAGFDMCDMPDNNGVWGAVLRKHGFYRSSIPNYCPDCYTAEAFCNDHPYGIYVLGFEGHVATVIDGDIYDTSDVSKDIPQYYWYLKEGTNYGL